MAAEILLQGVLVRVVVRGEILAESAEFVGPHHRRLVRRVEDGNAEQPNDHGDNGDQQSCAAGEQVHGDDPVLRPRVECHLRCVGGEEFLR